MEEYKEKLMFTDIMGEKRTFETERNYLNNNQMWWYSGIPVMYVGTVREAKIIAKHIKDNLGGV